VTSDWALVVGTAGRERAAVTRALETAGLVARHCRAEVAVDLLQGGPRLVVVDEVQPERDAAAVLRAVRARLPCVPLLAISRSCTVEAFAAAFGAGASAFVPSPIDEADLWDIVRRLATWRRPARPSQAQAPRCPLVLGVDVDVPGRGWQRGLVVDASATGSRVEMPVEAPVGARLGVVPRGCERSTEIRLGGTVRWVRAVESGRHLLGLRWSGTTTLVVATFFGLPPRPGPPSAG